MIFWDLNSLLFTLSVLPLYVHIVSPRHDLSSRQGYDLHCIAAGSRPKAFITWWMGNKQLLDHSTTVRLKPFGIRLILLEMIYSKILVSVLQIYCWFLINHTIYMFKLENLGFRMLTLHHFNLMCLKQYLNSFVLWFCQ